MALPNNYNKDLITKYMNNTDEIFKRESRKSEMTNQNFSFDGARTIKIYKITTAPMNDYGRTGPAEGNWSRYGSIADLEAPTEIRTLKQDRSFTFAIDTLDQNETGDQLEAASALARQIREVVIPEVDAYVYNVMCTEAGTKPDPVELTSNNLYTEILNATRALDDAEVPESGRFILVTPEMYMIMKQSSDQIILNTDMGQDMRIKGVIANLDGMKIIKVPSARVPENFGFLVGHPVACCAPVKLEDYITHRNPPGIHGSLVEGRIAYDAFVLDNKVKALYYQAVPAADDSDSEGSGN